MRHCKLAIELWWGRDLPLAILRLHRWLPLDVHCLDLIECIFDGAGLLVRKYRLSIERSGYGLFPGSEQTLHGSPSLWIDESVGVEEGGAEVAAEIDCVGRADILDDTIEYV